jgi:hypothetical protein
MEFTPIDPQSWPMAQSFYYYTQMAPTTYTLDVEIDVTEDALGSFRHRVFSRDRRE